MIIHDAPQGSIEWVQARLGVVTASEVSRIVTPTGKLSAQRDSYMADLLAERFLGAPVTDFDTEWTERGRYLEDEALTAYAFETDTPAVKCGLIFKDERREIGASPDGLIPGQGALELKCPMPGKHLLYLARDDVPRVYWPQLQMQLWVTGLPWVDFVSYHPDFPMFRQRVAPDPGYHQALDTALPQFVAELRKGRERLLTMGVVPRIVTVAPAPDRSPETLDRLNRDWAAAQAPLETQQ